MKLPAFDYHAPGSLDEAIALLAASGGTARPLAGGQSFLPIMAFRLASPSALVDLRRIPGLDQIAIGGGEVKLGAMLRWRAIEKSAELAQAIPLFREAIGHVAHYQIRNRGTVGGSLAHADPAAEFPAVAVACDAVIDVAGSRGRRSIAAGELFTGALETSLGEDEIITAVRFPQWPTGRRWGFQEFARRRGDFAIAGIVAFYDPDAAGQATNAHVAVFGATDMPRRLGAVEAAINGRKIEKAMLEEVAQVASASVDPPTDLHGTAEYRRSLVGTLLKRAMIAAAK